MSGPELPPFVRSQHSLISTLLSDGEAQELGHISDSCVKQLTQSNTVQMLRSSTEQEIQTAELESVWNLSFHRLKL